MYLLSVLAPFGGPWSAQGYTFGELWNRVGVICRILDTSGSPEAMFERYLTHFRHFGGSEDMFDRYLTRFGRFRGSQTQV